ncbi:MAG: YggS family pyridoxal phosphate-dependent enzyme [Bacteroidia bacterium]|nr:YggS family pyridoxal phosphate-dependent enzyme [Bacteroidia bacterium]
MIKENLKKINENLPKKVKLVVVTKMRTIEQIMEVYNCGYKFFGENRVQDLIEKYEKLPKDIEWNMIGHLQSNKVKYIAPFVCLIHSVDSIELAKEINKQAIKNNRTIDILLQFHIAEEQSKFGINPIDAEKTCTEIMQLSNIKIKGIMGMATLTENNNKIRKEFRELNHIFNLLKSKLFADKNYFSIISMGMSSDYQIAIEEGSNMVRIGSSVFL